MQPVTKQSIISPELAGKRLDQALANVFPEFSRERLKQWLLEGNITINGSTLRPKDKVKGEETIVLQYTPEPEITWSAEPLPLDVVYSDEHIIVVNKGLNCVVHPAAGHSSGTLVNALLHFDPNLANLPRAGIIHRLDKDTTGLLVIARTLEAHTKLIQQLQNREFLRIYDAIVNGNIISGDTIETLIGRHPRDRKRQAVLSVGGKPAITHYRLKQRFSHYTHLQVKLETGRTHQIRVHMEHIKHQLIGDKLYGGRFKMPPNASPELASALKNFPRQALHASTLGLHHPVTNEWLEWTAPLPADMQNLLELLMPTAAPR